MRVKNILFYFLSIIITFFSLQTPILGAVNSLNTITPDNNLSCENISIKDKSPKEREIEKYIDKNNGRVDRKKLGFVGNMFISDDDEIAKKEIEQLYFLGFFQASATHLGEEINLVNFFPLLDFIIISFIISITNWITTIFLSLPLMILVKFTNSNFLQKTGEYIQDLIINKILFSDGEKSLAFIILAVCTICALLITLVRSFKLKPSKVVKNLIIVLCMSITIGTFMQNTIYFHKTLEKAIQQPLDSLFCAKKMDNSIEQKSLIFNIFQEQSFLLRHFGVSKIEDISTLGNNPGNKASEREEIETPDEQYERLLLGYPEGKEKFGTENYAIHQALEPKGDLFQDKATKNGCANSCIKTSSRIVEPQIFFYFLISTLFMFPTFIIMFILLTGLLLVTLTSFLKPVTSLFSCFKCILEANFKMFFNVLFNTVTWFLFLPLIKAILHYVILAYMKIISFARTEPLFALILSFTICSLLVWICLNIRVYWKYFTDIIKGVSKFSLDAINPHSNAFSSINNKLIQPAVVRIKDKSYDLFHPNELNDISEKNNISGDEDIIGESCIEEISIGVKQTIKRNNTKDNLTNPTKEDILTNSTEEDVNKDSVEIEHPVNDVIDIEPENIKNMSNDKHGKEINSYTNEHNKEEKIYNDIYQDIEIADKIGETSLNIENNKDIPKDKEAKTENCASNILSDRIEKDNLNNKEKINNFEIKNNDNISTVIPIDDPITLDEEKEKIKADIFNRDEEIMSKKMLYTQKRITRRIYRKKTIPKKDRRK